MALPAFCPSCGHAVRVTGPSIGRCSGCAREVYANSRPTAGVLLVRGDRVLLIRRGAEPEVGKWDIPGGFLEEGEIPEDGACREIREELGLDLEPSALRLTGVSINRRRDFAVLDVLYEAPMPDQELRAGSDAESYAWFPIDDLPDDIAFEASRQALERWRARRRGLR